MKYIITTIFIMIALTAGIVSNSTTIDANEALIADGNSTAVRLGSGWFNSDGNLLLRLEATADAGTTPTLDVTIEHSPDCSTWNELVSFTQVGDEDDVIEDIHLSESHTLSLGCLRATYDISGSGAEYDVTVKAYTD